MIEKSRQGGLRILFADDEAHLRDLMQMELPRLGHEVVVCPDGAAALKALERGSFDAALLDIRMPGITGIEVLNQVKQVSPDTQVIILTGHATVDTAVQALRLGAFDYLTKPCKWAELEVLLQRIVERRDLTNKTAALETRLKIAEGTPLLIGDTPSMQQVHRLIDTIAPTEATVMILGDTGTGKELVARNLHDKSDRASRTFIPVNCGALPENLVESELFGHRKGAFTGAEANRKGLFEVANGGTLFLDEVGELDKSVQVKLLRFLESGEIRRVGENEPFRVDVRVLCATNRDLREMVKNDQFREDLFFRLNTFEIILPPLRERRADLPALCRHLLKRYTARRGGGEIAISPEALEILAAHDWPGNIRELANAIERAAILAGAGPIRPEHLPTQLPARGARASQPAAAHAAIGSPHFAIPEGSPTLRDVEMSYIQAVLEKHNGNKVAAHKELGISLKTLYNKINQLQQTGAAGGRPEPA
ncbi:Transcriptional regulatory protein ZraR [Aquisphaera giovannonii]|uniref:Transcriptional regulatory protein ZraR n=1 Tax=Aquisphaera giovannonii TaxID=406548 RepID=A0A5B9WD33_9BACT|nr:sigma-54 dependent transcriptional regulator [Aquisphaera giovannonii]QEH38184.1 Transcriptional regulatory protein ZraR [Aquisphaera giovannonii]